MGVEVRWDALCSKLSFQAPKHTGAQQSVEHGADGQHDRHHEEGLLVVSHDEDDQDDKLDRDEERLAPCAGRQTRPGERKRDGTK